MQEQKLYKNMDLMTLIRVVQKTESILATEELLKRTSGIVASILRKKSVPVDSFCDLSQECLIKIASSIKKLRKKENFILWVNQIVSHVFYDFLRKKQRTPECASLDAGCDFNLEDKSSRPYEKFKNTELESMIKTSIKELTKEYREAIYLRDVEGFSYDTISKITKTPLSNVKTRISRARSQLKKKLQNYLD